MPTIHVIYDPSDRIQMPPKDKLPRGIEAVLLLVGDTLTPEEVRDTTAKLLELLMARLAPDAGGPTKEALASAIFCHEPHGPTNPCEPDCKCLQHYEAVAKLLNLGLTVCPETPAQVEESSAG